MRKSNTKEAITEITHQIPGVQRGNVTTDRKGDPETAVNAPIENRHDEAPLFFREPVGQKTGRHRIASRLSAISVRILLIRGAVEREPIVARE